MGQYTSEEVYICVPISTNMLTSMTVSHTVDPGNIYPETRGVPYVTDPFGEGLVHIKSRYMLQPRIDLSFNNSFQWSVQ